MVNNRLFILSQIEGIRIYMVEYGDSKDQGWEKKYKSGVQIDCVPVDESQTSVDQKKIPRDLWRSRKHGPDLFGSGGQGSITPQDCGGIH